MDKMADVLGRVGAWCGQNKYLSAIKNSFQTFMPLTIAGAIGVLWCNVLVNADSGLGMFWAFQTFMPLTIAGAIGVLWCNVLVNADSGLGMFWKPIMALEVINPAFAAMQFATISCITVGITFGIAQEIGEANGETGYFAGLLGLACWLSVTQSGWANYALVDTAKQTLELTADGALQTFTGVAGGALGATGLFTGMIVGVVSVEIFCALRKVEGLKLKMPETVPPGVARAFEVLIPAVITLAIIALIGRGCELVTGLYLNDVISTYIQGPLGAIGSTIFTPLMLENIETFSKTNDAKSDELHIFAMAWLQMFGEFGGSGVTIGLVIAIMIFSKREDNRTIAGISLVPGLFNINETVTFGIPMVLNPILGIPFVFAPIATLAVGYILTVIGFCPKAVINTPWTTPPILHGFLTTGANIMGAVSQAIAIVVSILVYVPFLIAYERYQNKQAAEAAE